MMNMEPKKTFNKDIISNFMKKNLTLMIFSECSLEDRSLMIEGTKEMYIDLGIIGDNQMKMEPKM